MTSINELAKRRLEAQWEHMVGIQSGAIQTTRSGKAHDEEEARRRARNLEANRKYRHTEKGRKNNALQCKRYFQTHREQCQEYVKNYKKKFLEKYGVWFTAWNYWRKKLLAGKCTEADLPPQYGKILADWNTRPDNKYAAMAEVADMAETQEQQG